jgi:predicted secreted Zn-dependent protease
MELFKKYIMPKPQRQRKGWNSQSQEVASTNNLANEVKRIKIDHKPVAINQNQHIENHLKRTHDDQNVSSNKHKKQKIQWP